MAIKRAIKAGNKSIISFKKAIKVGVVAQLLDKNTYYNTQTKLGITATNNGDGSWTINGTATANGYINFSPALSSLVGGHKMLICGNKENSNFHLGLLNQTVSDIGTGAIGIIDQSKEKSWGISWKSGAVINNVTITPQLFDLTEMFGAGHEPATVAEFKAKFPEAYYPYQRAVLTVYNKVVRPCVRKGEVVQLVDPTTIIPQSMIAGVPITYNGKDTFHLSGTCQSGGGRPSWGIYMGMIKGHKYLTESFYDNMTLFMTDYTTPSIYQSVRSTTPIFEFTKESGKYRMGWNLSTGATYDVTITPQLFDLTEMYGAGNEPKTLADFRKDFPESYYSYSPIQTKNLFDIRKYTGLINSRLNNMSAGYFVKNLTQNSLTVKMGGYGNLACLKEPIILPAGTYTFSCDCDYDAINNGNGVRLGIYKKNEAGNSLVEFKVTAWKFLHRLVLTFTLEEETAAYLELQGDGTSKLYNNLNNVFFNIQLEKGSVATDYVPHDYI
mgnify:CR=1 FL=1